MPVHRTSGRSIAECMGCTLVQAMMVLATITVRMTPEGPHVGRRVHLS